MEISYKQHMDNLCNSVQQSGGSLQGCSIFMNSATLEELGLEACGGDNKITTDNGTEFTLQNPMYYKFEGHNLHYRKDESLPDKCIIVVKEKV